MLGSRHGRLVRGRGRRGRPLPLGVRRLAIARGDTRRLRPTPPAGPLEGRPSGRRRAIGPDLRSLLAGGPGLRGTHHRLPEPGDLEARPSALDAAAPLVVETRSRGRRDRGGGSAGRRRESEPDRDLVQSYPRPGARTPMGAWAMPGFPLASHLGESTCKLRLATIDFDAARRPSTRPARRARPDRALRPLRPGVLLRRPVALLPPPSSFTPARSGRIRPLGRRDRRRGFRQGTPVPQVTGPRRPPPPRVGAAAARCQVGMLMI